MDIQLVSTAAAFASSLAGVRTALCATAFTCAVIVRLSYGDPASIIEAHCRLDDVDQDNVAPIPVQQYYIDSYIFFFYLFLSAIRIRNSIS
jgi:hypothetical protein